MATSTFDQLVIHIHQGDGTAVEALADHLRPELLRLAREADAAKAWQVVESVLDQGLRIVQGADSITEACLMSILGRATRHQAARSELGVRAEETVDMDDISTASTAALSDNWEAAFEAFMATHQTEERVGLFA